MKATPINVSLDLPLAIKLEAVDVGETYVMTGTANMLGTGGLAITASGGRAASQGDVINILNLSTLQNHVAPDQLTVLGTVVPDYLADRSYWIVARYNGASWDVVFLLNAFGEFVENDMIPTGNINGSKLAANTVDLSKLIFRANGDVLVNNNDNVEAISLLGQSKVLVGTATGLTVVQFGAEGEVLMRNSSGDAASVALTDQYQFDVCFKNVTGGGKTFNYRAPYKGKVTLVGFGTTEDLATDAATITPKRAGANMTQGGGNVIVTVPAAANIGDIYTEAVDDVNTFEKGNSIQFEIDKVTGNGRGFVFFQYERIGA